jgi:hypothetical protein
MVLNPRSIAAADRPPRRKVTLVYRAARAECKSQDRSFDAATAVYLAARPSPRPALPR